MRLVANCYIRLLYFTFTLLDGVDLYTVKRLESGGFEVEFPCAEYLPKIRDHLDRRYPTIRWRDSTCRQEATLKVFRPGLPQSMSAGGRHRGGVRTAGCQLLVQLGNAVLGERRLWVTEVKQSSLGQQLAGAWIDTELCVIATLPTHSIPVLALS